MSVVNAGLVESGRNLPSATFANERSEKNEEELNPSIPEHRTYHSERCVFIPWNLACHMGHRWYAPRETESFIGSICNMGTGEGQCKFLLHSADTEGRIIV